MSSSNRTLLTAFPWHETSLGPAVTWPLEMHSTLQAIMASGAPMGTGWGDEVVHIYNDACTPVLGNSHPASFGAPLGAACPALWSAIEKGCEQVKENGAPGRLNDVLLPASRDGVLQECYFDIFLSVIKTLNGAFLGFLWTAIEVTDAVIARRRQFTPPAAAHEKAMPGLSMVSASLRALLHDNPMDCRAGVLFRLCPETGMPLATEWTLRADALFADRMRPFVAAALSGQDDGVVSVPVADAEGGLAERGCVVPISDRAGKRIAALLLVPDPLVPVAQSLAPFSAEIARHMQGFLHADPPNNAEGPLREAVLFRLARSAAHDFNNLLTVILGNLDVLEEKLGGSSELKLVANALKAGEQAGELTGLLLTFPRYTMESERPLDIAMLVAAIRPLLASAAGGAEAFRTDLGAGPFLSRADPVVVTSTLLSLVARMRHGPPRIGRLSLSACTLPREQLYRSEDGHALPEPRYLVLTLRGADETQVADPHGPEGRKPAHASDAAPDRTGSQDGGGLTRVIRAMRQIGGDVRRAAPGTTAAEFQLVLPEARPDAEPG